MLHFCREFEDFVLRNNALTPLTLAAGVDLSSLDEDLVEAAAALPQSMPLLGDIGPDMDGAPPPPFSLAEEDFDMEEGQGDGGVFAGGAAQGAPEQIALQAGQSSSPELTKLQDEQVPIASAEAYVAVKHPNARTKISSVLGKSSQCLYSCFKCPTVVKDAKTLKTHCKRQHKTLISSEGTRRRLEQTSLFKCPICQELCLHDSFYLGQHTFMKHKMNIQRFRSEIGQPREDSANDGADENPESNTAPALPLPEDWDVSEVKGIEPESIGRHLSDGSARETFPAALPVPLHQDATQQIKVLPDDQVPIASAEAYQEAITASNPARISSEVGGNSRCDFQCHLCDTKSTSASVLRAHYRKDHLTVMTSKALWRRLTTAFLFRCPKCSEVTLFEGNQISAHVNSKHRMTVQKLREEVRLASLFPPHPSLPRHEQHQSLPRHEQHQSLPAQQQSHPPSAPPCPPLPQQEQCQPFPLQHERQAPPLVLPQSQPFPAGQDGVGSVGGELPIYSTTIESLCGFSCPFCGAQSRSLKSAYQHVRAKHRDETKSLSPSILSFLKEKAMSTKVLYRCPLCSKDMLCDNGEIATHATSKHSLSIAEFRIRAERALNHGSPDDAVSKTAPPNTSQNKTNAASSQSVRQDQQGQCFANLCTFACKLCPPSSSSSSSSALFSSWRSLSAHVRSRHWNERPGPLGDAFPLECARRREVYRCPLCKEEVLYDDAIISMHAAERHKLDKEAFRRSADTLRAAQKEHPRTANVSRTPVEDINIKALLEAQPKHSHQAEMESATYSEEISNKCQFQCRLCPNLYNSWRELYRHVHSAHPSAQAEGAAAPRAMDCLVKKVLFQCPLPGCGKAMLCDEWLAFGHGRGEHRMTPELYREECRRAAAVTLVADAVAPAAAAAATALTSGGGGGNALSTAMQLEEVAR